MYRLTACGSEYTVAVRVASDGFLPNVQGFMLSLGTRHVPRSFKMEKQDESSVLYTTELPSLQGKESVDISFQCSQLSDFPMGASFGLRVEIWRNSTMLQYSASQLVRIVAPDPPSVCPRGPTCLIVAYKEMKASDYVLIQQDLMSCGIQTIFMDAVKHGGRGAFPRQAREALLGKATLVMLPAPGESVPEVDITCLEDQLKAGGRVVANPVALRSTIGSSWLHDWSRRGNPSLWKVPVSAIGLTKQESPLGMIRGVGITTIILGSVAGLSNEMKLSLLAYGTAEQHNVVFASLTHVRNYRAEMQPLMMCWCCEVGFELSYLPMGIPTQVTLKDVLLACLYIDLEREIEENTMGWKDISHLSLLSSILAMAANNTIVAGELPDAIHALAAATLIRSKRRRLQKGREKGWKTFSKLTSELLPQGNLDKLGTAQRLRDVAQDVIKALNMPQPSHVAGDGI
mmetsp:Transcript_35327/g.89209  ORF Transcript_35327/g.89209 Transcript_35327/m.89209 type:complete len:458 (+) Transcript_35327:1035-2408(+)